MSRHGISACELRKNMITNKKITVSFLVMMFVTGCSGFSRDHFIVGSEPEDYRMRHPIIVSQSKITEDIPVSANMRKLSFRDYSVTSRFGDRFLRSGGRVMQIIVPSQSVNEMAAKQLSRQIVGILVNKGINRSQISVTRYRAGNHSSSSPIRLSFSALAAHVGKCGKWEQNIVADSENRQYENFGCATQNNLARMIVNPADLIGPRGETEIDATRRNKVIKSWQESGSDSLPR